MVVAAAVVVVAASWVGWFPSSPPIATQPIVSKSRGGCGCFPNTSSWPTRRTRFPYIDLPHEPP